MGLFGKSKKEKEREAAEEHARVQKEFLDARRKAAAETAAKPAAAGPSTPQAGTPGARPAGLGGPAGGIAPASTGAATGAGTYTVQSGDSLSKIAREKLGDGNRWREIYDANREVIGDDPDLIKPGQRLRIPGAGGGSGPTA